MKPLSPPSLKPEIQPRSGLAHGTDLLMRHCLPCLFVLLVTLVLSAPLNIPAQAELMPAIVQVSVFLWSVFRPSLMPSVAVFGLGMCVDLLSFEPPGVMLLIMLVVHGVGLSGRYVLARLNVFVLWLVFGIVMVFATALQWVLCSALALHLVETLPFMFECILAFGSFPVLYVIFVWTYRFIVNDANRA